jgi:FtsP/CotA-like multicopper oxidase with cupredoxin domain
VVEHASNCASRTGCSLAEIGHWKCSLTGLFYLDDGSNSELPRRYGIDDIPIILQDRSFDSRGRFLLRDRAVTGLLGDTILVNGTYNPHLSVTTRRVRLRILNASTARIYHLAFADERDFAVLATDCGFLPSPRRTPRLLLSPAERAEVLVEVRPGERRASLGAMGPEHDHAIDQWCRWQ